MLETIFTLAGITSLLTLVIMEVVLGIDNIVFISILCDKLPQEQRNRARQLGLIMALAMRIILLFGITWLIGFKQPLFNLFSREFSGKDLILLAGGLESVDHTEETLRHTRRLNFSSAIFQIILLDVVFSVDSILTAVGMVEDNLPIMVTAVIISMLVMLFFSKYVSDFINRHPTVKMLALSFLLMIGLMLVAEGMHFHVPKGYIYFSMAFSLFVEILNIRTRKRRKRVA
jgi:predicted tellurium resistance membrane protein TerC